MGLAFMLSTGPVCCGKTVTLRLRPKAQTINGQPVKVDYVAYECRKCGKRGGLAITEREAWSLWE